MRRERVEILNRKQLEDAAKCEKKIGKVDFETQEEMCKKCSCHDGYGGCAATFEAAQTALAYRAILKRHMWHKRSSDGNYFCIECGNRKDTGHTSNCELAAQLKGLEG
jgi:uncharacterized FAD-dependent dehydrogenase